MLHISIGVGIGGLAGDSGGNGGAATDIRTIPTYYHCTDTSNCCQGYNNLYLTSTTVGSLGGCNNIERVILASSVQSVGSFGFNGCQYLKNVTIIGSGLRRYFLSNHYRKHHIIIMISVEYQGFCQCFSLQSIALPESFTTFSTQAFWVSLILFYVYINFYCYHYH